MCLSNTNVLKLNFHNCRCCTMMWTPVSMLGRSDKVVFNSVVFLWRYCSRVLEPGMC